MSRVSAIHPHAPTKRGLSSGRRVPCERCSGRGARYVGPLVYVCMACKCAGSVLAERGRA
jgi:DnaJ-class molecular chaperone